MRFAIPTGSLDEARKKSSRPPLLPGQLLGMALDAQHELAIGELHALHQAVGRMRHGAQRRAQVPDGLVVEAVHAKMGLAEGSCQQGAGLDFESVDQQVAWFAIVLFMRSTLDVQVLPQRAFARDVEDLYAAAD